MRLITSTDHPSNIAVFQAADMEEATYLADKALKRPLIQGAVWNTKPVSLNRDAELKLGDRYRPRSKEGIVPQVAIKAVARTGENPTLSWNNDEYEDHPFSAAELDETRRNNLFTLSKIFGRASLNVRHQYSLDGGGHYDAAHGRPDPQKEKLFLGLTVSVTCAREKLGTLIRDTTPRQKWWEVAAGNYLFMVGENTIDKALYHAQPIFKAIPGDFPRTLDLYKFHHQ